MSSELLQISAEWLELPAGTSCPLYRSRFSFLYLKLGQLEVVLAPCKGVSFKFLSVGSSSLLSVL